MSKRGVHKVGVRTLLLHNSNQLDILNSTQDNDVFYDRPLKVEVWYPAVLNEDDQEKEVYDEVMGNHNDPKRPLISFQFKGRAKRAAQIKQTENPYPLVIFSHGYTGSRLMFSYLTEQLASQGYIVVSIDHPDSTFRDASGNKTAMETGHRYMRHGGTYVLVGLYKDGLNFIHPELHAKETTLLCSRNATRKDFIAVIELLSSGLFPVLQYITHQIEIKEVETSFDLWTKPSTHLIKALLKL